MATDTTTTSLRFRKFAEEGELSIDNFEVKEEPMPEIKEGQLLLRNLYLSCDPTHRIYASGKENYLPACQIGGKMACILIGEIIASKSPDHAVGTCVISWGHWETHTVIPAAAVLQKIDPTSTVPLEAYGAVVNMIIGLTAWVGVRRVLQVKKGDTVCVSGAAGAVGSLVCQLAKQAGAAKVVGLAGSADKCEFLRKIGCDGAINYKTESVRGRLKELCPEGYSCYFDNVGGEITEAALESMSNEGRVAVCGMISQYDQAIGKDVGRIKSWDTILFRRLSVRGFLCIDHAAEMAEAFAELEGLLRAGSLSYNTHVWAGDVTKCVEATQAIIRGTNTGKALVRLAAPSNPAYKCA